MQVAVADVAVPEHFEVGVVAGDDGVDVGKEGRYLGNRDGDVVLVGRPVRDGLRDVFAQFPQVLQLLVALAHHAIDHPAFVDAMLEGRQRLFSTGFGGRLEFQQRVERRAGLEGCGNVATAENLVQAFVGEKLEGSEVQLVLEGVQHRHDRIEVRRAQYHGGEVGWLAFQAHGGFNDEAQGAFGADEQLAQVVAGGVLDQVLVQFEQVALAGDDFQPGHPVAGHPIANHLDPAGIGADIATDLARTGRGEIHRVIEALVFGVLLQLSGDHTRLTNDGAVHLVEREDLVHVIEGDHHLATSGHGRGGKAGTPPGGHQSDMALVGPTHDSLYLLDRFREHDGRGCRSVLLGPVLAIGIQRIGIGQHLARLDQGLQLVGQGEIGHLGNSHSIHGHPEYASAQDMGCFEGPVC